MYVDEKSIVYIISFVRGNVKNGLRFFAGYAILYQLYCRFMGFAKMGKSVAGLQRISSNIFEKKSRAVRLSPWKSGPLCAIRKD